jgi:hypothetical protein
MGIYAVRFRYFVIRDTNASWTLLSSSTAWRASIAAQFFGNVGHIAVEQGGPFFMIR